MSLFPYTYFVPTIPARHECHACCPLQVEKPGIQPVAGNTHGSHHETITIVLVSCSHVKQVVSSFQKILRSSQLTWYIQLFKREGRKICLSPPPRKKSVIFIAKKIDPKFALKKTIFFKEKQVTYYVARTAN